MSPLQKLGKLRGHDSSVTCCEFDSHGNTLLTGSEDCTSCLFDMRSSETCVNRIRPSFKQEVTSVSFTPVSENILFLATGTHILTYDLRKINEEDPLQSYNFNSDDIGMLCVSKGGDFIACADDSGEVKVINTCTHKLQSTLKGFHSSICSSVQFHPRKNWEVLTGGLDCFLTKWDFSTHKLLKSWNMNGVAQSQPSVFNPPFVHSIATPPFQTKGEASRHIAVARGDGCVCLYDIDERQTPVPSRSASSSNKTKGKGKGRAGSAKPVKEVDAKQNSMVDGSNSEHVVQKGGAFGSKCCLSLEMGGHSASVSYVTFGRFDESSETIVSGGNDKKLILWKWKKGMDDVENDEKEFYVTRHARKVNWMSTCGRSSKNLVVADTSKSLTLYNVL